MDKCPLCTRQDNRKLFATNGYDMQICNNCDLLFISPFPHQEQERFDAVAANALTDITVIGPEKYAQARQVYYQELFPLVKPFLQGADTLLDIGCGTGHLLKLAIDCGVQKCAGLELNRARAQYARQHTGCEIFEKPIEQFQTDHKYDVITLIDVLSHIYSYDKLFEAVRSLLSDKGVFVIKTGQFTDKVKAGSVYDWEVPDHLHFLGLNTIKYIAGKYNMEIISENKVAHADELYTKKRFLTQGRSRARNMLKALIAHTPLALPLLKQIYLYKYGRNVFSIVVALRKVL